MSHEFKFEVVPVAEAVAAPVAAQTVLIVDDEPLIVDSLGAILSRAGLQVMKAYGGRAALEMALEASPDLLLTDVAMPGMNGIDLAMAVAGALPRMKVLLFSAHASTLDLSKPRSLGYDFPLLSKPAHPTVLLDRVFEALAGVNRRRTPQRNSGQVWSLPTLLSAQVSG